MTASQALRAEWREEQIRVLIVDDDDVLLEFLQICLESELPDAVVTAYDSMRLGRPGPDFDWAAHDVLLLDYNLGHGETGLDWLEAFAGLPGFPRTILLTAEDSATVVGSAVLKGADGYLNKSTLTPDALVDAVKAAMHTGARAPAAAEAQPQVREPVINAGSQEQAGPEYQGSNELDTGPGGASYRFIRLIGRGGMSRVYLAERSEDRTAVVLKILDCDVSSDIENVQRFAREGELLSRINSPYVVKVFDHGATNSYGYIAMEFFGRGDLAQRMMQRVSAEDAVLFLHNIACGLDAIHREGIVHRDLKPGNIMFRSDGSMALVDFGLSKCISADVSLTQTGAIMGTPYCMSPEQTVGVEADHRADLYAAGVMFFEMLSGRRPFTGRSLPELLLSIQSSPVPRLPAGFENFQPVVDRLLAKEADDRYQSATQLIDALGELVLASASDRHPAR